VRRLLTGCFLLLVLAPAAEGVPAREPARLTYRLDVPLSGPAGREQRFADGGLCLAGAGLGEGSRLTRARAGYLQPSWSPDARRIVFQRDAQIVVRDERGRERMVADFGRSNEDPAWSPDGRRIAFTAGSLGRRIYSIRPDGSDARAIVQGVFPVNPAWSPDGRSLAYSDGSLYVIDALGANRRKVAEAGREPSWSPDGRSIVFVRDSDLVIAGADGQGERLLTRTPAPEHDPAWSPDGHWIAFERNGDIRLIRPDGSGERVARGSPLVESGPAWRPPGPALRPGQRSPCVVRGSARSDVIRGSPGSDVILAGSGRDSIFSGRGEDVVDAGPGPDLLFGGGEADLLNGGFGSDRLSAGAGDDLLMTIDGDRDSAAGGPGFDCGDADSVDRFSSVEALWVESFPYC
jgi:WD40 repeat protein